MKRGAFLLRTKLLPSPPLISKPNCSCDQSLVSSLSPLGSFLPASSSSFRLPKLFSTESDSTKNTNPDPKSEAGLEEKSLASQLQKKNDTSIAVADINNKELKILMEKYFKGDEEALPAIMEAILSRKLAGKHEETDDELMDELQMKPLDGVKDKEFESDFEDMYETDEEIDDLYNARDIAMKKMVKDEYFNMSDTKWDDMVKEATDHGFLKDTRECEAILEDMLSWDKLLPDHIKEKVEKKFNEIGDMVEQGEIEVEKGYELFKEFEDEIVMEYAKTMEAEGSEPFEDISISDKKNPVDDPPGEGPILRWETRVVFAPGGDSWHPKNRKVKMAVTVKELGLSKHQFRRLRELVGKRYDAGKDELTITSERYDHREENRKDCLRTLFALVEEAGKANKLVEEARAAFMKERLKINPVFMEKLRMKKTESNTLPA